MVYIAKTNIHEFTVLFTSNHYETCSKTRLNLRTTLIENFCLLPLDILPRSSIMLAKKWFSSHVENLPCICEDQMTRTFSNFKTVDEQKYLPTPARDFLACSNASKQKGKYPNADLRIDR
jgi:hypothetical protein